MKKIAILGCENSHANAFLRLICQDPAYADVQVVGVYSDDDLAAQKLHDEFDVPVLANYADAKDQIDGLIITARHGDNHYKYAKPYVESGIPMFVDKPITISEQDAHDFAAALAQNGVRVSGGSSLKQDAYVEQLKKAAKELQGGRTLGGFIRAPYQRENAYGGFYFYAQHLVEMVCEIFGRFPLSVTAKQNGDCIHVLFHYEKYDCVGMFCNNNYTYTACRMSESGTECLNIPSTEDWYAREFAEFYGLLKGGKQPLCYEEFFSPVFILNAIHRSLQSGREEAVGKLSL
ncbi:MAG: Gfo/Idh/MocA family oxidoreductase [Ruminococcaceae bacterium]|nr:Gfo/Idh/MocA family oxidoreductase [Oscillospiraceae bacterium]